MIESAWHRFFFHPRDTDTSRKCSFLKLVVKAGLLSVTLAFLGTISTAQQPRDDLTAKSIEDLMNLEVTSVSKKEEKLFQTAAAVYVITQEEIRRSGLTSLPELLRLVPGLQVGRIDGTKWAVSARGFNGRSPINCWC
jgi:iron complex outermembrane receptor protein